MQVLQQAVQVRSTQRERGGPCPPPSDPYLAHVNNSSIRRVEHVQRHERTHTKEKPFACGWARCGKTFGRRLVLYSPISRNLPVRLHGTVPNGPVLVPPKPKDSPPTSQVSRRKQAHVSISHRPLAMSIFLFNNTLSTVGIIFRSSSG